MSKSIDYIAKLTALGWHRESEELRHQIAAESCHWYDGKIAGVEHSAWIGTKSRKVYPHGFANPDDEFGGYAFEAFVEIVEKGWPVVKSASVARGFDFGDD